MHEIKNIRVICSDIDGTLLDKERDISSLTHEVFSLLPKDMPVILASSRMPSAMTYLQEKINRAGEPLICYNGGYVLDNDEVVSSTTIPLDQARAISGMAEGTEIHISLYAGDEWIAPKDDAWTKKEIMATRVNPLLLENHKALDKWEKAGKEVHKVMCMGDAREMDHLYQRISERYEDQLHLYRSKDTYIEIAPISISKASALELLLKQKYGFSLEQVMSFGDNFNDIELLKSSGVGVAVANAKKEVIAASDITTEGNKEDGVAKFLRHYLAQIADKKA